MGNNNSSSYTPSQGVVDPSARVPVTTAHGDKSNGTALSGKESATSSDSESDDLADYKIVKTGYLYHYMTEESQYNDMMEAKRLRHTKGCPWLEHSSKTRCRHTALYFTTRGPESLKLTSDQSGPNSWYYIQIPAEFLRLVPVSRRHSLYKHESEAIELNKVPHRTGKV